MTTFKRLLPLVPLFLFLLLAASFSASPAFAAAGAPGWTIDTLARPANFSATQNQHCTENLGSAENSCDSYQVVATDAGSAATLNGSPVTIEDTPPPGLTVQRIEFLWSGAPKAGIAEADNLQAGLPALGLPAPCTTVPLRCVDYLPELGPFAVSPGETLKMVVYVTVNEGAPATFTDAARVSGGGAPSVSTPERANANSSAPASFGPQNFDFSVDGPGGVRDTQAGDHPYQLTTTIDLNSDIRDEPAGNQIGPTSVQDVKDVVVDLPLGLAGSTLAAPTCTIAQLSSEKFFSTLIESSVPEGIGCQRDTIIGHLAIEPNNDAEVINSPIWNITPERGVAAEFGYIDRLSAPHVFYVHVVPSEHGYVLQTTSPNIPQVNLTRIVATFYGFPEERDAQVLQEAQEREVGHPVPLRLPAANVPFFTDPTTCGSEEVATIHMDSWQHPARFEPNGYTPDLSDPNWVSVTSASPPMSGCDLLRSFTPELLTTPTTGEADTPSGLEFEMKLPQSETPGVLATPALKRAEIVLPQGMTVDPSAGGGLEACSEAQIGWTGPSQVQFDAEAPSCPEASKIGSLELETPLIPRKLEGEMYLAAQDANPFGSVLAAYVVVNDPVTGVLLKIAGEFKTNPATGQVTAVFDDNPQLPFSDLKLHFFGGPRAELATPDSCGTFTTDGVLTPWSAPGSGPSVEPFSDFQVTSGCVSGFAPSFGALSTNLQAGAYTPFIASFSRSDTDQELAGLTLTLPPGLLANVASVPLCPEPQASTGACPESSQVGQVTAFAGPGPNPLFVPGKVYLTGPYNGGPYGLTVVVPAVAGPFRFGTVIVRQSLRIDPYTAQVTDVSDAFPTILDPSGANGQADGIPIKLRRVDVEINRPGFTFNPTNCSKLQVGGSITSTQGQSSTLATPFQVTNCATLKFAPKFSVSTSGRTSRANGASLAVQLTYPSAPFGSQANIARVKVELPKQLPSRLTTLQKACAAATFEANPANCPAASIVGHAKASTPILPVPLEGPAYFVSHGGEAFPSLIMVLQGNGVTLDLVGSTFINKAGITSSTFKTVPDAPVGAFELTLPEGSYSALAANGNLCKGGLSMPTEFVAQNGTEIHERTKIAVTGCGKSKKKRSHRRQRKTQGGRHGKRK